MIALLDKVIAVAAGLTAGELFSATDSHGKTAGTREIEYHKAVFPSQPEGKVPRAPSCLALEMPSSIKDRTYGVALVYVLHNDKRQQAQDDITRLKTLLMGLYEEEAQYLPCALTGDKSYVGDERSAQQSHPEYQYTVQLTFTRQ